VVDHDGMLPSSFFSFTEAFLSSWYPDLDSAVGFSIPCLLLKPAVLCEPTRGEKPRWTDRDRGGGERATCGALLRLPASRVRDRPALHAGGIGRELLAARVPAFPSSESVRPPLPVQRAMCIASGSNAQVRIRGISEQRVDF
jgi:hypothetical protein